MYDGMMAEMLNDRTHSLLLLHPRSLHFPRLLMADQLLAQLFALHSVNPFIFVFSGASNMVTGETKSFFSFAKSVSQTCGLSFSLEGKKNPDTIQ